MNGDPDTDIERLLRQVRPIGPPDSLRERITAASTLRRRSTLVPIAALGTIAFICLLQWQTHGLITRTPMAAKPDVSAWAVAAIVHWLGDPEELGSLAEFMVLRDSPRQMELPVTTLPSAGDVP